MHPNTSRLTWNASNVDVCRNQALRRDACILSQEGNSQQGEGFAGKAHGADVSQERKVPTSPIYATVELADLVITALCGQI